MKMQKCQHLVDALKLKTPKLAGEYLLSEKKDGWYVQIPCSTITGWGVPISSAGRPIPAFEEVAKTYFRKLPKPTADCFLIAEAVIPDTPFEIMNGIFNRTVGDYACLDVQFHIHDVVYPYLTTRNAWDRYTEVSNLFSNFQLPSVFQQLSLLYKSEYEPKVWFSIFERVISEGGEGIVAKRATSGYSSGKRNSDLLKLKLECTVYCEAVRLEESIGDKGIPALTLVSRRLNGTEVRTVIGKHVDQEAFRLNPTSVIGKIVEVKAMNELEDGQLRQPVFKTIRTDKSVKDIM